MNIGSSFIRRKFVFYGAHRKAFSQSSLFSYICVETQRCVRCPCFATSPWTTSRWNSNNQKGRSARFSDVSNAFSIRVQQSWLTRIAKFLVATPPKQARVILVALYYTRDQHWIVSGTSTRLDSSLYLVVLAIINMQIAMLWGSVSSFIRL